MTDRLVDSISSEPIRSASRDADNLAALTILGAEAALQDPDAMSFSAQSIEIVALRLATMGDAEADTVCKDTFELLRALLQDEQARSGRSNIEIERIRTRAAAFGVLGGMKAQTRQLLDAERFVLPKAARWDITTELATLQVWQLLIRKSGWKDFDLLREHIGSVRTFQAASEPPFLRHEAQASDAWKIICTYHLLRAAEIIAEYTEHGSADEHFDPTEQAELHFDRAKEAADESSDSELMFLVRLLDVAARTLVERSIWTIARGAGTRAIGFVNRLTSRTNPEPLLELLPPQHKALVEEGLLNTGRRSVVVSLPTSAGKTLIAEFRMLQALDSYEAEQGWVAYTAPNRALVNQLTARLRRDFAPLGIRVERFSPALEVDSVEAEIIGSTHDPFRVVVTTPEKLDLLLRGGWVSDLGRPLSLVIVDEAHNLGNKGRGLKLELLLATINREARHVNFLLMTPFIPNASDIANWLDSSNNQAVELGLEWLPNDRVVGLAKREPARPRGSSRILAETMLTSAPSLHSEHTVELMSGRPLGLSYSKLNSPTVLATATAEALSDRGSTVTLVGQPRYSWSVAERLAESTAGEVQNPLVETVGNLLSAEYGTEYPLTRLLRKGVAVHHAGLSDDVRIMIEALAEKGLLRHIVATTTLAQGIDFPINNVVFASYQYPYGATMPPEDFWNIAGRAGRANHGQPGIILLAAHNGEREAALREYLTLAAERLGSTLLSMIKEAVDRFGELDLSRLSFIGSWSSFVQFIAHTFRTVGAQEFSVRVEQVLRGTLGFRELRSHQPEMADALVRSVQVYASKLVGKPISLVDSTGFSWESVSATMARMSDLDPNELLVPEVLFSDGSRALGDAIGILLQVPELREQLVERLDPAESDGNFLSRIVKDWVGGLPLNSLANEYFATGPDGSEYDHTTALTRCCQRLFGSILPSVSWGLSALQSLSMAHHPDADVLNAARDVPSYVYYGVDSREAIALRLYGVPRTAAIALAQAHSEPRSTLELRQFLASSTSKDWTLALGSIGRSYYDAWRLIEPVA